METVLTDNTSGTLGSSEVAVPEAGRLGMFLCNL